MQKYKCIFNLGGYDHILTLGKIYNGIEEEGIFKNSPYLVVYDDSGNRLASAHL